MQTVQVPLAVYYNQNLLHCRLLCLPNCQLVVSTQIHSKSLLITRSTVSVGPFMSYTRYACTIVITSINTLPILPLPITPTCANLRS